MVEQAGTIVMDIFIEQYNFEIIARGEEPEQILARIKREQ
jgi:hypothetical protein